MKLTKKQTHDLHTEGKMDILRLTNSKGREIFRAYYNGIEYDGIKLIDVDHENGHGCSYRAPEEVFLSAFCAWNDNTSCKVEGSNCEHFIEYCKGKMHWMCPQLKKVFGG